MTHSTMTQDDLDRLAGHTPGPWFPAERLEPHGGCLSRLIMATDTCIAEVLFDDEDDPTAEANARVIAAAPDLLAENIALKARVKELETGLERNATALNAFIYIIAHRFDGDGSYYWMRDPTRDEAQAAMEANNNASASLSTQGER